MQNPHTKTKNKFKLSSIKSSQEHFLDKNCELCVVYKPKKCNSPNQSWIRWPKVIICRRRFIWKLEFLKIGNRLTKTTLVDLEIFRKNEAWKQIDELLESLNFEFVIKLLWKKQSQKTTWNQRIGWRLAALKGLVIKKLREINNFGGCWLEDLVSKYSVKSMNWIA